MAEHDVTTVRHMSLDTIHAEIATEDALTMIAGALALLSIVEAVEDESSVLEPAATLLSQAMASAKAATCAERVAFTTPVDIGEAISGLILAGALLSGAEAIMLNTSTVNACVHAGRSRRMIYLASKKLAEAERGFEAACARRAA